MDIIEHIEVEHSQENVFLWMFQPQHIVQLINRDYTKDFTSDTGEPEPPPWNWSEEQLARHRRWQEQAETVIEIKDLSTPTLQAGTTFRYTMGIKNRSEEFPPGRALAESIISIKKSVPFRFFSFRTGGGIVSSYDYQLTFQAHDDRTIITYHRSNPLPGKIARKVGGALISPIMPDIKKLGGYYKVVARHQLRQIKAQMEAEIH